MYCIHASIMRTMAFSQNHDLMNVVQCSSYDSLPAFKSEWHPLAPIHISESTNENNMTILEDIYINQMGKAKDDPWFQKGLFLCAGDLKTVERMLSVKTLGRETASRPYDRYAWLLPIPGLWHLKLNFLFMLSHVHKHSGAPVDDTSLQYAIDKWDRSGLMAKENFKDLEELIIHSYDARILGLLMQQIRKLGLDFDWKDKTKVKEWISSQSSTTWKQTIVNIHQRLHPRPQDFKIHDEKWNNERRFCNHVEAYLLLDHAIRIADIGLLRRALGECAVLFQAKSGRKPKYARELLRMVHMIDTDASSPSLQKAVLAGCLDNLRGLQNSHLAKDLLLELHNGFLKQNKSTRQSSTKDIPAFLDQTSLNSALMQQNRSSVEALTKTRLYSSKHPMKITTDDIFALARDLSNKTLVERSVIDPNRIEYRNTLHASPDLYIEGFGSLEANITAYNKQIIEGFDLEAIDSREKVIYDGDDLPLLAD